MHKIRFLAALYVAKLCRLALKLLGRNATYLPGKIALKLDKQFLAHLKRPKTVIAVTGTNGKTTVSNLLSSILTQNGYSITNNSFGSNVQAGVATALLADATLTGKAKKDIAVLEVDERSSLLVYKQMEPDYLLCTNIMRDSIKRNAHTEFISHVISSSLAGKAHVMLNADDMISSALAPQCENRTYFSLDAEKPTEKIRPYLSDIVYCPKCGSKLENEYLRYNHIGRMYCPGCGHKSPTADYLVTGIDRENSTFTVVHDGKEETYNLINDNIVNVYNFCASIALLSQLGLDFDQISKGFTRSKIVKTRYDQVRAGDLNITVQMAKGQNPIACARCFDYVASLPGENKGLILNIDDLGDNIGNSETTCWLYDCDFSYLADPSIGQIVFTGPRCKDQKLRALMVGVDMDKVVLEPDPAKAAYALDTGKCKDIFILFELYRDSETQKIKEALVKIGEGGARHDS